MTPPASDEWTSEKLQLAVTEFVQAVEVERVEVEEIEDINLPSNSQSPRGHGLPSCPRFPSIHVDARKN